MPAEEDDVEEPGDQLQDEDLEKLREMVPDDKKEELAQWQEVFNKRRRAYKKQSQAEQLYHAAKKMGKELTGPYSR